MAQEIDVNAVCLRARRMTDDELLYAERDALEAAIALNDQPMIGKDSSYYRAEASVYYREQKARRSGRTKKRTTRTI